ncbi:MAG TPA: hypothetical protein VK279_05515 [Solirubrobacteraceae bacterium]|nr:hypothetical protein [Solirubrobacteraceae bacterium]
MSDEDLADLRRRVRALEQQVAWLTQHTGPAPGGPPPLPNPPDPDDDVPADVRELARAGNMLGAIKRYRQLTGCDLHTARSVVESL